MTHRAPKTANRPPEQLSLDFQPEPNLKDETVSAFEAKQERRRQRLLDRAERQEALAETAATAASEIADGIPMGQPILVGHHSEKADRRRRDRMQRLFSKAHDARKAAENLHRRADAVGTAGISADDPNATSKLEDKASALEAKREVMKRANAYWREHKSLKGFDELDPKERTEALRTMLLTGAEVPFPSWALRNIGARIRQAKTRVQEIAARDESGPQELQGRGFRIFEDREDNQLVIEFDERQSQETCRMLHQAGFHWARSRRAWTRQLTNAAWASAHSVAARLTENSIPTPGPEGEQAPDPAPQPEPRPTRTATVLRELRASASEWWYHTDLRKQGRIEEARQLERASMRSTLGEIRATLANDGWLSIGRGGATLHYSPNAHVEGLHPHHIRACIAAGIPTLDSTAMDIKDVYELSVRGPMPSFTDEPFGTDPDGGLSKRQWRVIFNRYAARPGAVFHNYQPDPTPWSPEPSTATD